MLKRRECSPINIYAYTPFQENIVSFYRLRTSYAELSDHNSQANLNEDNLAIYYITLGTYCPQEIQVEEAPYLRIDSENIIEYKPATCKFRHKTCQLTNVQVNKISCLLSGNLGKICYARR